MLYTLNIYSVNYVSVKLENKCIALFIKGSNVYLNVIHWGVILELCLPTAKASLVAKLVKNLPAMWETWVRSLGWEDPLEKGKATNSSILAWRIPWPV